MKKPASLQNSLMLASLAGASDSVLTAAILALVALLVIGLYSVKMRVLRHRIPSALQLPFSVAIAATLTSLASLAVQAWALELHQHLALWIGLIALQCVILECNGFFTDSTLPERLRLCGLFASLMMILGLLREGLGHGSVAEWLVWLDSPGTFRFAIIAPGGFILLGLLLATRQAWLGRSTPIDRPKETLRP